MTIEVLLTFEPEDKHDWAWIQYRLAQATSDAVTVDVSGVPEEWTPCIEGETP